MEAAAIPAMLELLAAYGVTIQQAQAGGSTLAALGVVRFTASGMRGTAIVGATPAMLKRSNKTGSSDCDWITELANQFFGRFKLKLLRSGFGLWSMAPVAVTGRLLATGVSQPQATPFRFADAEGRALTLWIEIEVTGEIKIETGGSEIPNEGDIILF
jgi:hypothetical protein